MIPPLALRPRGCAVSAVLLAGLVFVSAPSHAQTQPPRYYMIGDLGPGDAYHIHNYQLGVMVGALNQALCPGASGSRFGFYSNGWIKPLCPLAGDASSEAFEVVGFFKSLAGVSRSAAGVERPVIWNEQSDGSFLPAPLAMPANAAGGIAWNLSFWGEAVGEIGIDGERRAAYWQFSSWAPSVFPLAGPSAGFAVGWNGETFVTGQHQGRFMFWYPWRSTNAVVYPLGDEPSIGNIMRSNGSVLFIPGQRGPAGASRAFLWRSDTGVGDLPGLGGGDAGARDLDAWTGRIVGFAADAGGRSRAVLWENGTPWDLNRLALPVCREDNPALCDPFDLEVANGISDSEIIIGSGSRAGVRHAFYAQPVDPLPWNLGACAEPAQPYCVAYPVATGTDVIIDPLQAVRRSAFTTSIAENYKAAANGYVTNNGIWTPNASAAWRSFAIFDAISVLAHLPPGQTQLQVHLHFKVEGSAAAANTSTSTASVGASIDLRPARNYGSYGGASGSLSMLGGNLSRYGLFAGQGAGPIDVDLPLTLDPVWGPLDVRIEGSAGTSLLAAGDTWASGDVSVLFCSEDPRSITLADGTPLADAGIRYTLYPTIRRQDDDDDPCKNPLKDVPNATSICPSGVQSAGDAFRIVAPDVILPGELAEIQAVGKPPGGSVSARVESGNAVVERIGTCTLYPDGSSHCPVFVRASGTLEPDAAVVVRVVYATGGCQLVGSTTLLGTRLQFVDPVSGDAPRLIDRTTPLTAQPVEFLRRDPALLAVYGRRVRGLAADGVTPVLLRFRAPGPGTVTFTVADDRGSRDATRAGRLADPLGARPVAYTNPVTVAAQQVGSNWWAFAVITSPIDFARPGIAADLTRGQATPRELTVTASFTASGGSTLKVQRDLDLVRPPVTLIHGVWSSGATWNNWGMKRDGRFFTYAHDYAARAGLSFLENGDQAYWGVRNTLEAFRWKGIAATQADVIGHSMGGILSRIYAGGRIYAQSRGLPQIWTARDYREAGNFGAGTIHKLVMLDSPQLGSPVANYVLSSPTLLGILLYAEPRAAGGALEDLQRGGAAIQALPPVALPVHAIVGQGGGQWIADKVLNPALPIAGGFGAVFANLVLTLGSGAQAFLANLYFPEPDNDVIVGVCSQRAGLSGAAAGAATTDYLQSMHLGNTSSADYNAAAVVLLNAPVASASFAPGLLPPPGINLCGSSASSAQSTAAGEGKRRALVKSGGGLAIISPAPGTSVTAGAPFAIHVEATGGFVPQRIFIGVGPSSTAVAAASFDGTLEVPDGVVGDLRIAAVAVDAQDQIATATPVTVRVDAPAVLTDLATPSAPVALTAGSPSAPLTVTGHFADGIDRDVTSASAGTTYASADPGVATVDANGRVTAHAAGHTVVQATNGDDVAVFDVNVADAPDDADGDGKVDLGDFLALRSCWTGPSNDPSFAGAANGCRDAFDSDADGDVDRADYDAFRARYTGPAADCNHNGTLDLTDIVDATSQDANGDGVPDECGV